MRINGLYANVMRIIYVCVTYKFYEYFPYLHCRSVNFKGFHLLLAKTFFEYINKLFSFTVISCLTVFSRFLNNQTPYFPYPISNLLVNLIMELILK